MANPSALKTLIDLATTETDEAAVRLGSAIRYEAEAVKKLLMLTEYRDDYAARFQASMANGLSAAEHRNFQQFMDKLETAIRGQEAIVEQARNRILFERKAWQAGERKRMSFSTLEKRATSAATLREGRRDQKQTDEFASRQTARKQMQKQY